MGRWILAQRCPGLLLGASFYISSLLRWAFWKDSGTWRPLKPGALNGRPSAKLRSFCGHVTALPLQSCRLGPEEAIVRDRPMYVLYSKVPQNHAIQK